MLVPAALDTPLEGVGGSYGDEGARAFVIWKRKTTKHDGTMAHGESARLPLPLP